MGFQEEWDQVNSEHRNEMRKLREEYWKKQVEIEEKYRKKREDLQKNTITPIVRAGDA